MNARRQTIVTRWWWIRHAPVRRHENRLYGQDDLPADVSDAESFEGLASGLPPNALWVTTHLQRTHQTAAAIAAAGHAVPEALIERDFVEQHFGAWQGLTFAEIEQAMNGAQHKFWVAPAHHAPPEGESFLDVIERAGRAIERFTRDHAGRDIVAVAHGGTIRAALQIALGAPPDRCLAFTIDNLSLTRIDHIDGPGDGGQWRVVAVNAPAKPLGLRDRR